MRLLVVYKKGDKYLLKIALDDGKEKWMETTSAVYNFAKNNLKGHNQDTNYPGDEVDIQYTEKNGQHNVTRISKKGANTQTQTDSSPAKTGGYTCEDCGKELKDDKYKKCYTCNKKNPTKKSENKYSDGKFRTPEQITKDEIGHMTARTMVSLQGHVNPNNVVEVIKTIYQTYVKLVG